MRVIADVKRGLGGPKDPYIDIMLMVPDLHVAITMRLRQWAGQQRSWLCTVCWMSGASPGKCFDMQVWNGEEEPQCVDLLLKQMEYRLGGLSGPLREALHGWWVNEYRQLKLFVEPENQNEDGK
jgi:hypothetical protein